MIEKGSGDLIGAVCVQHVATVEEAPLEVGWRMRPVAHGKGYATEAGKAAMQFAFDHLKADLVLAVADRENIASHKVMQRLGMTLRGTETHYGVPMTT